MRITAQAKNATRQRILNVAKKLFAEQGFEATTTRDIACESQIAVGTLFNYFPAKESIVLCLVSEACARADAAFADNAALTANSAISDDGARQESANAPPTLEEELFAHIAAILRKLKPYRKYLPAVLETSLSPLARDSGDQPSLRTAHLETVGRIAVRHGLGDALSTVALQLYWTLYTGVLAFWAQDRSPRQEDTLALLDQSLAMFLGWLTAESDCSSNDSLTKEE